MPNEQWVIKIVHRWKDYRLTAAGIQQSAFTKEWTGSTDVSEGTQKKTSRILWCNLVVYFNSTNFSKKLQNTQMERTQDSQFFLLFLLFVYIVSSHGDYSYIQ